MTFSEFSRLPEFKDNEEINIKIGEYFLSGDRVIKQKYEKKPGDIVTVYKLVKKTKKDTSYIAEMIRLNK